MIATRDGGVPPNIMFGSDPGKAPTNVKEEGKLTNAK